MFSVNGFTKDKPNISTSQSQLCFWEFSMSILIIWVSPDKIMMSNSMCMLTSLRLSFFLCPFSTLLYYDHILMLIVILYILNISFK